MKLLSLLVVIFCLPLLLNAQTETDKGINFEQGLTWKQIKAKAKKENKYIFVDCYATWCGPCKLMDETVYPKGPVGEYYNSHFISIKVQMDKTDKDDSLVKAWYSNAASLASSYTISAFPTFLYFSPDGEPVHKITGGQNPDAFISTGHDAQNPDKQYYQVLKNFQPGKLDTSEMKGLAYSFQYSDTNLARKIAVDYLNRIPVDEIGSNANLSFMASFQKDPNVLSKAIYYIEHLEKSEVLNKKNVSLMGRLRSQNEVQDFVIQYVKTLQAEKREGEGIDLMIAFNNSPQIKEIVDNYINHLLDADLFKKDNIRLMYGFTKSSSDRGFHLFYKNDKKIDQIAGHKGYAQALINTIITTEEINPLMVEAKKNSVEPAWNIMEEAITKKYNSKYDARLKVVAQKPNYYIAKKDWKNVTKSIVEWEGLLGLKNMSISDMNEWAWQVFLFSDNRKELNEALKWSSRCVQVDTSSGNYPGELDTKANLLYKLGKTQDAIKLEEKAVAMSKGKNKDILETFDKMKKGHPTWIVPVGNIK